MKHMTQVGIIVLCCAALAYAASVPGKDSPLPDRAADMDAMTAQLTNATEQALHAVRIPEVVFAQANVFDCIYFVQISIARHAPEDAKLHPRIVVDLPALPYLRKVSHIEGGPGLLTYGVRNVSALHLIRHIEAMTELRFVMKGELVIVEKKPANKELKATGEPAP